MTMNGKAIAMAVAGLLLAVAPRVGQADDKTKEAKVKCGGINSCKGKGSCHGAGNSCAGKNGCKGQGITRTTKEDCQAKGGKILGAEKKK